MAISRTHVWAAGEVLTASDLNAEFNGIITGGTSVAFPLTANVSFGGYTTYWDVGNTIGITGVANGLSLTGGAFNTPQGNDVASASTLNLDTATGNLVDVTGTTTVTAITLSQGRWRWVRFTGALTLTNGASLVLPGAADIITVAGDYALFFGYASSVVRCAYFSGTRDVNFSIRDNADPTKIVKFEASGITTGTTRTITLPDANFTPAQAGVNADITSLSALTSTPYAQDVMDFRLTLTTGLPVTIADVIGATTIYCTPYKGKSIALYDGSTRWNVRQSAEFSLALGTITSALPYDVFCYDNAGIPTLEFLAWTNATSRATNLVYQDGILSKTGALTRRYLGTFYTTSTTQTEDSAAKRDLWNYYNRVARTMLVQDSTDSWTYTTATFRQFRATATNQLEFIRGVDEDAVSCLVTGIATGQSNSNTIVGIGLDSTSAKATNSMTGSGNLVTGGTPQSMIAIYSGLPGLGRHLLVPLEYSTAAGTTTWYGDNGGAVTQSGISAQVMA